MATPAPFPTHVPRENSGSIDLQNVFPQRQRTIEVQQPTLMQHKQSATRKEQLKHCTGTHIPERSGDGEVGRVSTG
jgi:hypothetical protein